VIVNNNLKNCFEYIKATIEMEIYVDSIDRLIKYYKLFSVSNRLIILNILGNRRRLVSEIIDITGLSPSNVSYHLSELRKAGLIYQVKKFPHVYYEIVDKESFFILQKQILKFDESITDKNVSANKLDTIKTGCIKNICSSLVAIGD